MKKRKKGKHLDIALIGRRKPVKDPLYGTYTKKKVSNDALERSMDREIRKFKVWKASL